MALSVVHKKSKIRMSGFWLVIPFQGREPLHSPEISMPPHQRETMQDNNTLATSALQLQCILGASAGVGVLIVNDREEVSAANPPAGKIFDLSPQAAMEAA